MQTRLFTDLPFNAELYDYCQVRPLMTATFSGERSEEFLENYFERILANDFRFTGEPSEKVLRLFKEALLLHLRAWPAPTDIAGTLRFIHSELTSIDHEWSLTMSGLTREVSHLQIYKSSMALFSRPSLAFSTATSLHSK